MSETASLRSQVLNSVLFLALTSREDGDPPRDASSKEGD